MKLLDELELRRSSLLNYYVSICLSNKLEDRILIGVARDALFFLDVKIKEVQKDKIRFIDNPELIIDWLSDFNEAYKVLN